VLPLKFGDLQLERTPPTLLFLDRKSLHVVFDQLGEGQGGLVFARNLLFHRAILSQFPDYLQTYLTSFVGQVEHSLASQHRV
jgi:hypothetical protein